MSDPDALLVREAQGGSRTAFDMLVLKYQRRVERLLSRSVRDPADVADLCQETFLAAYRALPAFRGDSAFYTWVYRIAINAAQRHRSRQRPVESLDDDEGTFGTAAPGAENSVARSAGQCAPCWRRDNGSQRGPGLARSSSQASRSISTASWTAVSASRSESASHQAWPSQRSRRGSTAAARQA